MLGFTLLSEAFREDRQSWRGELALNGEYLIELCSFPSPPARVTNPEACGLRHIAFEVDDFDGALAHLATHGVEVEPVRFERTRGRRFTFFKDPDLLPIELFESQIR